MTRIAILQAHPDAVGGHLCHALADAYEKGAAEAGHEVRKLDIARLDFPLLRSQAEFASQPQSRDIGNAQEVIRWAQHLVIVFPLWHGTLPALLKAFLEQVFRPGFALDYGTKGFPKKLLGGRSARIVVKTIARLDRSARFCALRHPSPSVDHRFGEGQQEPPRIVAS